jgi:dienelactone hydrolase
MRSILFWATLAIGFALPANADDLAAKRAEPIWDLQALSAPPAMRWVDDKSPVRSLIYGGETYRGHPTEVFAFYATPATVDGEHAQDKKWPGIVLVHGGGGTAFAEWTWLWARRGYVAIAMDLSGRRPAAPTFDPKTRKLLPEKSERRITRERLELGGPEQDNPQKFETVGGSRDDDWPYHAVASVILANSLLRSFPEVDADRIALTGISWGGYTTCIAASVDNRFKAAVYGCGHLYDGESVQRPAIDRLDPPRRDEWIRRYDPSSHLAHCRVPIFFVNGTNDPHYPLVSYAQSYALVKGPRQIRIEVNMRHSHPDGWKPAEIGLFVDQYLRGGKPLPQLGQPHAEGQKAVVECHSEVPLKSAQLHATTDRGKLVDRKWVSRPAAIRGSMEAGFTIEAAELPANASIWLLAVTDNRDAMVTTDVVFSANPRP